MDPAAREAPEGQPMGALRLLMAMWVAAAHGAIASVATVFPSPTTAVLVFFAISGFLMTTVLSGPQSGRWISTFYLSRALRIFPLYWLILAVTIACDLTGALNIGLGFGTVGSPVANIQDQWAGAGPLAKTIIVLSNITTVGQDILRQVAYVPATGAFALAAPVGAMQGLSFNIIGQAWSLGPEVLFYAAAPFLVRRPGLVIAATVALAALQYTHFSVYLHFFPPFMAGAPLAHVGARNHSLLARAAMIAALVLALLTTMSITSPAGRIVVVVLILAVPLLAMMRSRVDTFLGDMSYPLYISHFLVMQACHGYENREVVTTVAMLAAAALLTIFIDHPLRRLRHALTVRAPRSAPAE